VDLRLPAGGFLSAFAKASVDRSLGFGRQFRRDYGVWVSEKSSSMAEPEWLMKLTRR
jgi:hypothetical protein